MQCRSIIPSFLQNDPTVYAQLLLLLLLLLLAGGRLTQLEGAFPFVSRNAPKKQNEQWTQTILFYNTIETAMPHVLIWSHSVFAFTLQTHIKSVTEFFYRGSVLSAGNSRIPTAPGNVCLWQHKNKYSVIKKYRTMKRWIIYVFIQSVAQALCEPHNKIHVAACPPAHRFS
jgi:hypothetical protein